MKLKAFQIKNFRSIIDTGLREVSPDNINVLIGQNEAGKTSVLDALYSFEESEITADDVRSDGTLPEIYCEFQSNEEELKEIFEDKNLPAGILDLITKNNYIVGFTRKWSSKEKDPDLILTKPDIEINSEKFWPENETQQEVEGEQEDAEEEIELISKDDFIGELLSNTPTFISFEDSSLLPRFIDLNDIQNKNTKASGYRGAVNFLNIIGFDVKTVSQGSDRRIIEDQIEKLSKNFTADFQKYWGQKIGKNDKISILMELKHHDQSVPEKVGQPYLTFYIKDAQGKLYPDQRSQGIRWFVSFYLQLEATAKQGNLRTFLIDEPGGWLHAKAQEDVLKVFEKIKKDLQILYTTHSPYLIDVEHVHRILAVQRDDAEDDKSPTKILTIQELGSANKDTLFPLYTVMGINLSHQGVIKKQNNILLEEISGYFYFKAFWKLFGIQKEAHFLPTTGVSNMPLLANLMLGWDLHFLVVVDDESSGRKVFNGLKDNLVAPPEKLFKIDNCKGIEDLFSKGDFKKHVLEDTTITYQEENSEFVKHDGRPKPVLARDFMLKVNAGQITLNDLTKETKGSIQVLLDKLTAQLK